MFYLFYKESKIEILLFKQVYESATNLHFSYKSVEDVEEKLKTIHNLKTFC